MKSGASQPDRKKIHEKIRPERAARGGFVVHRAWKSEPGFPRDAVNRQRPWRGGAAAMALEVSSRAPAPASSTPTTTQPLSIARYPALHESPTRDDIGASATPLQERRSCVLASASDTHIVPIPRPDPRSRESEACRTPWEITFRLPLLRSSAPARSALQSPGPTALVDW